MAWEQRKNGNTRYYYRGTRDANGRVHKTYLGSGAQAAAAAEEDEAVRADEARRAAQHQSLLDRMHAAADHIKAQHDQHDFLLKAALLAAGFRNKRGEWKRRRHGRQLSNAIKS